MEQLELFVQDDWAWYIENRFEYVYWQDIDLEVRLVNIFDMQVHHLARAFANINEQKHIFNVKSNADERIAKIKNILEEAV